MSKYMHKWHNYLLLMLLIPQCFTLADAFALPSCVHCIQTFLYGGYSVNRNYAPCLNNDCMTYTKRFSGEFSAYTASPGETDSTPYTMASNKRVFDGAVANNCMEFGTRIRLSGKVYVVEDRMNQRYGCDNFDIFMWDRDEALEFGRRKLEYTLL